MSNELRKWDPVSTNYGAVMVPALDGTWIKHEDHLKALSEEKERHEKEMKKFRTALKPIIEEINNLQEGDFSEPDWNENYTLKIGLTVKEIRNIKNIQPPKNY